MNLRCHKVVKGETVTLASRILLVEDQLLIAMDAEAMLNDYGYLNIATATNLDDARKAVEADELSLVILDINLGNVTTFELAKELVAKNIPIAFASGYTDHDTESHDLGHIPVITKPFGEDELLGTVTRLIRRS